MKKIINVSMLFCSLAIIAQDGSKLSKKIEKISKRYDFSTSGNKYFNTILDCDNLIVGDYGKGPSDGGGSYNNSIKNLKLINIHNNQKKEITDFNITLPFSKNSENYNHLIRIKSNLNGLIGVMDNCGNIIVKPKYNHINAFNKDGLAVCFKDNSIQIINSNGDEVLKESIPYNVPYKDFWSIPLPGKINNLSVIGNSLILNKNNVYSLYDIKSEQVITKNDYTFIEDQQLIIDSKSYLRATKENSIILISIQNGSELIPEVFKEIIEIKKFYNKDYIYGRTISNGNLNIYDLENKQLVLPLNSDIEEILPINDQYDKVTNHQYNNLWILYSKTSKSRFLYDSKNQKYLIEPDSNIKNIFNKVINNTLLITYDGFFRPFNLQLKEFQDIKKGYKPILLYLEDNSKNEVIFLRYNLTPKSYMVYDNKWNIIVDDLNLHGLKAKRDFIYFYELVNGEKKYTAYDINGKLIGESRNFKLN